MTKPRGSIIKSQVLVEEFRAKELNRRRFIEQVAAASAGGAVLGGLPGCVVGRRGGGGGGSDDDDVVANDDDSLANDDDSLTGDDDDTSAAKTYLVGMGAGEGYKAALMAAMDETVARDGLANVVSSGDVVFLKVNSNSGDMYPYSTRKRMVEEVAAWCWDQGASRVIVGDRSFWGDGGTLSNLTANEMVAAAQNAGAELLVLDEDDSDLEWVEFPESDAADWVGGFRYPRPVVEADVLINLPIVKTHFISTFTMGMKNMIGLVNADDRSRAGNLDVHITSGNKLYKQIAQLNQQITPSLTLLDGWEAVVRGGPTDTSDSDEGAPGLMVCSTDRIAADAVGLAILKKFAHSSEELHNWGVWDNPQMVEAIAAGVGVTGPKDFNASGPTVEDFDEYMSYIL